MLSPGSCVIIDHKTTSEEIEEGRPFWFRLRLDPQPSNYIAGARTLGYEPVAAVWDVIRKPSIHYKTATPEASRKYTKEGHLYKNQRETDEPLDEWRARLRADIKKSPDSYYRRGIVVRAEADEREAAEDTWAIANQIAIAREHNQWPRHSDACKRYGRLCEYIAVCTKTASLADPTRYRKTTQAHEELALDDGKRHLPIVSTSSMKTFQRCAREYFYSYVLGYRPLEKAAALEFGTLVHQGLEVWWSTVDLDKTFQALKTDNDVDRVSAEELLRGYHARWIDEPFNVLAVEQEFRTRPINPRTGKPSDTFELAGKIDAIACVAS